MPPRKKKIETRDNIIQRAMKAQGGRLNKAAKIQILDEVEKHSALIRILVHQMGGWNKVSKIESVAELGIDYSILSEGNYTSITAQGDELARFKAKAMKALEVLQGRYDAAVETCNTFAKMRDVYKEHADRRLAILRDKGIDDELPVIDLT